MTQQRLGVGCTDSGSGRPQVTVGADVGGDDRAALEPLHDPRRQVVEDAPVAQQLALVGDGWGDPWDGHARAHPDRQRAAVVDDRRAGGQVGGDAEERAPELLDLTVSEDLRQPGRELAPSDERDARERVVVQEVVADEGLARHVDHLDTVQTESQEGGQESPHARPAGHVDRHPQLLQGPDEPDVGEAPCSATTQHDADTVAGDLARQ